MRPIRWAIPLLLIAATATGCPVATTNGLTPTKGPTRKPSTVKVTATATPSAFPTLGATPDPSASPTDAPTGPPSPSATPTADATATPAPTPSLVSTLAGATLGNADGPGADARFNNPNGVDLDAAGNLYVADAGNHRIRVVTPAGETRTLAGSDSGLADGLGAAARFNNPYGVAVAADGTVYVADTGNHCIRRVTAAGDVTIFAGTGFEGFVDGAAGDARFSSPFSVALGPEGALFVADAGNHAIRKIAVTGAVTTLVGGVTGNVNGSFSAAKLAVPNDLAYDGGSKLYVADALNHSIRMIDLNLKIMTTLAGSGTAGFVNEKGVKAKFNSPTGVAMGANGEVLVADSLNHAIRRIGTDGTVTTVTGGAAGMVDGAADLARFDGPTDLVTMGGGVLIADTNNHRIRAAK